MTIDARFQTHLRTIFAPLNRVAAAHAFPPPRALAEELLKVMPSTRMGTVVLKPAVARLFATAAVDVWLRGVHTFLVSTALTHVSPIWASVSGYYSSHYSVRAIAHLLGYFQLFQQKCVVRFDGGIGGYACAFDRKQGHDREHRFYWKMVKSDPHFRGDPLFTENNSGSGADETDVGHRDRANYADHLGQFPEFRPLDAKALKDRVEFISGIPFASPPIPRISRFPDLENVQVVAYHRLVRFRVFLDQVLGGSNRFWSVHRDPSWAREMMDFQLVEQGNLAALGN